MRPFRSKPVRILLVVLALPAAALVVRAALAPRDSPAPGLVLSGAARERVETLARASAAAATAATERLADLDGVEVLLVGEEHFYLETQAWLGRTLDSVPSRQIALLLELPAGLQPEVDRWVAQGSSPALERAMEERSALPYGEILAWAHRNRDRLSRVVAMDEDRPRIVLNRALLRDTRNETMARAILTARRARPADLVVAYGGQLHMLLDGRYRYDQEDRVPAGARVLRAGVPRERVRCVLLSGKGKSPVCDAWAGPGVLATSDEIGNEAWPLFVDEPLFRVGATRDLFDYLVHLGSLTRVPRGPGSSG